MTPPPGIYESVDFDLYRSWEAVNNSSLGPMRRSAAHYHHALTAEREETDALRFGTLAHAGKLEPLELMRRYCVMPDLTVDLLDDNGEPYKNPRATKAYKNRVAAWKEANADKEEISQAWFDQVVGISQACNQNARANDWLSRSGSAEVSILWQDAATGLMCKGRIDKLTDGLAVDLKTTRDAGQFEKSIADFGYARQAAFYLDGLYALTGRAYQFGIIAVERDAPHGVRAAVMSDEAIAAGRLEYRDALQTIAAGRNSQTWASYAQPNEWDLPRWSVPSCQLIVSGQIINL